MLKHLAVITAGFSEVWNTRNQRPNNVCQSVPDCNKQTTNTLNVRVSDQGWYKKTIIKKNNKSFQKCSHL